MSVEASPRRGSIPSRRSGAPYRSRVAFNKHPHRDDLLAYCSGSSVHILQDWQPRRTKLTLQEPLGSPPYPTAAAVGGGGRRRRCSTPMASTRRGFGGTEIMTLHGHYLDISSLAWCPSSPFLLATSGEDNWLTFWDTRKPPGTVLRPKPAQCVNVFAPLRRIT